MNDVMHDVTGNTAFMGGVPCIFGGDQRQILPITQQNSVAAALSVDIKGSRLWRNFRVFKLQGFMRNRGDPEYAADVDNVGNGIAAGPLPVGVRGNAHGVYVPEGVRLLDGVDDAAVDELLAFVHPNLEDGASSTRAAATCAVASPFNAVVDELNRRCLERFRGILRVLSATHELPAVLSDIPALATEEHMSSVSAMGVPAARLELKVGCLVMCLRNLLPQLGIQNGTLLRVTKISDYVIQVETLPTSRDVQPVQASIPRILFAVKTGTLTFHRRQFPLRLAYARSINKMQGATITRLGLDMRSSVFSHGQLYVALSRVADRNSVRILGLPRPPPGERAVLHNVVYRRVLGTETAGVAPPLLLQERVPYLQMGDTRSLSTRHSDADRGDGEGLAPLGESDNEDFYISESDGASSASDDSHGHRAPRRELGVCTSRNSSSSCPHHSLTLHRDASRSPADAAATNNGSSCAAPSSRYDLERMCHRSAPIPTPATQVARDRPLLLPRLL